MSMIELSQFYRTRIAGLADAIPVPLAGGDTVSLIAISLLMSLFAAGFRRRSKLKRTV